MSWSPQYTITDKLLLTIRQIGEAIGEIKSFNLTDNPMNIKEAMRPRL